jgi:[ribosomal protein S18]-alanine N-acetyltransferase
MEGHPMSAREGTVGDPLAIAVRKMQSADAADVPAILKECSEAAQWSKESLGESLLSSTAWIAEYNGRVAGFLVGRAVADEFEILNMAVSPKHRRLGIAGRLVDEALCWSRTAGARRAYLEVRASNAAAISLYLGHGFTECGRRARYYLSPSEDAILLSMGIDSSR